MVYKLFCVEKRISDKLENTPESEKWKVLSDPLDMHICTNVSHIEANSLKEAIEIYMKSQEVIDFMYEKNDFVVYYFNSGTTYIPVPGNLLYEF